MSHQPKPEHKTTNVPEGWREVLIDSVARRGSGHTPSKDKPEYWNGGIKWISLADSSKLDNRFIAETDKEISALGIKNSSAVMHTEGTVLLSRDAGVGKSAIMAEAMAVSQHFITWKADEKHSHNIFLYYWLQQKKSEFEAIATGSTIKTIGLPYFKKLEILLPPLPEQIKIASILSDWDNSLSILSKLIEAKRQQKRGLAEQLLTGKRRLPGFEGEWEKRNIGDMISSSDAGEWGQEADESEFSIPVIRATNFDKQGGLNLAPEKLVKRRIPDKKFSRLLLQHGDIILEKSGGSPDQPVGRVRYFDTEGHFTFSNFMNRLRPKNDLDSKYLFFALNHFYDSRQILEFQQQTTGIINLQLKDYLEFGLVNSPSLPEQKAIASMLSTFDAEISSLSSLHS